MFIAFHFVNNMERRCADDEDFLSNPAKQAKVKEFERQIDQMVYELYGLTPEEIVVVEGINN